VGGFDPSGLPFRPVRPLPVREKFRSPLKINVDWRHWFTVFSVHYEALLKFEELLFLKSVTVQYVVLYKYNTLCYYA